MPHTRGDPRTVTQILFSRKRPIDIFPQLHGQQPIPYPARRNPRPTGFLSAMLCKACVVALDGHVLGLAVLAPPGVVMVRSRSQSSGYVHQCYLTQSGAWLPFGSVTYHLGLLYLAEALAWPQDAEDLLDAVEELLTYRERQIGLDERYLALLMHLSDELYYWARWRAGNPRVDPERLNGLQVYDVHRPPEATVDRSLDARALTDLSQLQAHRHPVVALPETVAPVTTSPAGRFRGPQLAELVESLDLGMHCLLVGPTATGKSLCALEAFERAHRGRRAYVLEGHESLKEFDLLGGYTPDGEGGFLWRDGVLVQAMRAGGYLFIDEANRMPTRTLNVLLGVLSRGALVLTEHGSEEIVAQEGFQVVMAMNLGSGYAVNALDRALLDRFGCVLAFHYLPPEEEETLLIRETGIDPDVARIMVRVAGETRRLRRGRELSGELTPRNLFAWAAKYVARGSGTLLQRLTASAQVTWMHAVAGTDADGYLREESAQTLGDLIEAHTPR